MAFTTFVLSLGFFSSKSDAFIFIYSNENLTIYFLVYVDDSLITGNSTPFIHKIIDAFSNRFSVKDIGSFHHFLGVEVILNNNGILLY